MDIALDAFVVEVACPCIKLHLRAELANGGGGGTQEGRNMVAGWADDQGCFGVDTEVDAVEVDERAPDIAADADDDRVRVHGLAKGVDGNLDFFEAARGLDNIS